MFEILLQIIATQAGLRPLEHPALFDDLFDDAPPQAGFVCIRTSANKIRLTLRVVPASLREIEDYWWER